MATVAVLNQGTKIIGSMHREETYDFVSSSNFSHNPKIVNGSTNNLVKSNNALKVNNYVRPDGLSRTTGWQWGQPTKYIKHFYQISSAEEKKIRQMPVNFGFGDFGKLIFYSHYSRTKNDGSFENWHDVAIRCASGSMTIIKNYMKEHYLPWRLPRKEEIHDKSTAKFCQMFSSWDDIANIMGQKITQMRMLPPGRGLWGMGELAFKRGATVLSNCGAASTHNLRRGATWAMNSLMHGTGVGFDTEFQGPVWHPNKKKKTLLYIIPDTREGWVESLGHLIRAYVPENGKVGKFPIFDYSKVRPKGAPIRTFGGTASGPEPLRKLHRRVEVYFDTYLAYRYYLTGDEDTSKQVVIFHQLVDRLLKTDFSDRSKTIDDALKIINSFDSDNEEEDEAINRLIKTAANWQKSEGYDRLERRRVAYTIKEWACCYPYSQSRNGKFGQLSQQLEKLQQILIKERVDKIKELITEHINEKSYDLIRLTVDIMNSIGACVVAGNVRRSSMLAKGRPDCPTFSRLKDYSLNPERVKIAYMSNNSVEFTKTEQYSQYLPKCAKLTRQNGEPGYFFRLNVGRWGRVGRHNRNTDIPTREMEHDPATIPNPCSEIPLCPFELCMLVELPINRFLTKVGLKDSANLTDMFDLEDFLRCCVLAVIYGKSVSILPTDDEDTNAIVSRNRRIGISITGGAQVHDKIGSTYFTKILKAGYSIIRQADRWISGLLGVRESIRVTTCKPSGTVSLVSGSTAGVHFCHSRYCKRTVRFADDSNFTKFLIANDLPYIYDPDVDNTYIFEFFIDYGQVRSVSEVSMYEQMTLLAMYQREWADNMVSVTVTFNPEREGHQLEHAIAQFAPILKSVSFLPNVEGVYANAPFQKIDQKTYQRRRKRRKLNWELLTNIDEAAIPRGCTNDVCSL